MGAEMGREGTRQRDGGMDRGWMEGGKDREGGWSKGEVTGGTDGGREGRGWDVTALLTPLLVRPLERGRHFYLPCGSPTEPDPGVSVQQELSKLTMSPTRMCRKR